MSLWGVFGRRELLPEQPLQESSAPYGAVHGELQRLFSLSEAGGGQAIPPLGARREMLR